MCFQVSPLPRWTSATCARSAAKRTSGATRWISIDATPAAGSRVSRALIVAASSRTRTDWRATRGPYTDAITFKDSFASLRKIHSISCGETHALYYIDLMFKLLYLSGLQLSTCKHVYFVFIKATPKANKKKTQMNKKKSLPMSCVCTVPQIIHTYKECSKSSGTVNVTFHEIVFRIDFLKSSLTIPGLLRPSVHHHQKRHITLISRASAIPANWLLSLMLSGYYETTRPNRPAKYVCQSCGKAYKWRDSLNLHRRNVCGIEPRFPCSFCGRKFWYKHHMRSHEMSIHRGETPVWTVRLCA